MLRVPACLTQPERDTNNQRTNESAPMFCKMKVDLLMDLPTVVKDHAKINRESRGGYWSERREKKIKVGGTWLQNDDGRVGRTTRGQIFWGDSVLVISIEKINEKINE